MERSLTSVQKEMLALERFFPHHLREKLEELLFALSVLFLSFSVLFAMVIDSRFGSLWPVFQGLFLVAFALLLKTILIEVYFNSLRMRLEREHEMSFATLLVIGLHHPKKKDLAKAFLHSRLGKQVALRLGIAKDEVTHFVKHKERVEIELPSSGYLHDIAGKIHDEDPYFRDFLERIHVSKELLMKSSEEVEKKHHRKLSDRPLLSGVFRQPILPSLSLDVETHKEIEELEHFYRIIITEQATAQIVAFFKEHMLRYVSEDARIDFLTELIEYSLTSHKERFHGASIILPADARSFLINKKALE